MMDWHIDDVRHRVVQPEGYEFRPSTDPVLPDLGLSGNNPDPSPNPPAEIADPPPPALHRSIRVSAVLPRVSCKLTGTVCSRFRGKGIVVTGTHYACLHN